MGIILILIVIALFLYIGIKGLKKKNAAIKEGAYVKSQLINNIKYTCGHPNINKPEIMMLGIKTDGIHIMSLFGKERAVIPDANIKNISIEDASTIQRRPTVVRFLALGILAFAWQKKKKDEQAYLVIEWNDGRFDHDTIFEYTGIGSTQKANEARNKIIKQLTK